MSFFDDASWVLIPEGIKEDVVYAQKPTNGLGDLAFTRASDATRTNSAGVIERTPWNLLQQSEMFSQSPWNINRISAFGSGSIVNDTIAPNGTLTADYIQQASGQTLTGGVFVQVSYILGQSYTLSVYAKKKENNYLRLGFAIGTGQVGLFGNFDLNTGVPGTPDVGVTQTIQDVGNGWYRCSITATSQVTTTANTFIYNSSTLNSSTTTPLQGIYIWGAQLVEGTDAKPYFPTTNRQDVPRLDYRNADGTVNSCPRLLLEPQRTNSIRNSTMVGAVAGSPGTLPTNNWTATNGGLTQTIVGIGNENGLQYIDLRFNGTANTTAVTILFEGTTNIATLNTQTWTNSFYTKLVASPAPPLTYGCAVSERNSFGGYVADSRQEFTPTTTLRRFTYTISNLNASTAYLLPFYRMALTNGATYDFTIRIAAPQMELGNNATTFIPTTTAAVTRVGEDANRTGASAIIGQTEGTVFYDVIYSGSSTSTSIMSVRGLTKSLNVSLSSNLIRLVVNGVSDALIASPNTSLGVKMAIAYNNTGVVLFANGVQINLPNTGAEIVNNLDVLQFRSITQLNFLIINQAALFPTRLSNEELALITTI